MHSIVKKKITVKCPFSFGSFKIHYTDSNIETPIHPTSGFETLGSRTSRMVTI